jgi:hypothetical protein
VADAVEDPRFADVVFSNEDDFVAHLYPVFE